MDLLTIVAVLVAGHTVYSVARSGQLRAAYRIAATLRVRHFTLNLPVLVLAIAVAAVLYEAHPAFRWGWTDLLGGGGNVMLGGGAGGPVIVVVVAAVIGAFPLLAQWEEEVFRAGSENRTGRQRLAAAACFGAVHALVGVPLAAVAALTVAGWWYTNRYLAGYAKGGPDEAIAAATRAHLAWNYTAVGLFLLGTVL